jgi:hypothetical protein
MGIAKLDRFILKLQSFFFAEILLKTNEMALSSLSKFGGTNLHLLDVVLYIA